MNNPSLKYKLLTLLSTAVIALLMAACSGETVYPRLLVDADSAYVNGDYALGDSLLDAYRQQKNQEGEAVGMYRRLVETEQAYFNNTISEFHFAVCDSLCRYYENCGTPDNYAKALLFMGNVSTVSSDFPSAVKWYMKAKEQAEKYSFNRLLPLICREMGDLYFDQRMLDDCLPYYQRYYYLSSVAHDLRRTAYAAFGMGRAYTVLQEVDSTVFYYKKAIELGHQLPKDNDIVSYATRNLCDIYIQIEEYDSARCLMTHTPLHYSNWAYWYLGQNQIDSAVVYFQRLHNQNGWILEVERLRVLARIEQERGNYKMSTAYYQQLADAQDSLEVHSQVDETRRTAARFNYESIKKERDEEIQKNRTARLYEQLLLLIGALLLIIIGLLIRSYKLKQRQAKTRHYMLQQELERQKRTSYAQLEENKQRIELIQNELDAAQKRNDTLSSERLQLEKELLKARNLNIELLQQQKSSIHDELLSSDLVKRIKSNDLGKNKRLTDAEWQNLRILIDRAYDNFTERLLSITPLTDTEMHICYLVKLGIQPTEISEMLCKSKSAITMSRKRMSIKLMGSDKKTSEIDHFIENF